MLIKFFPDLDTAKIYVEKAVIVVVINGMK
jgi:hypothetical protein